MINRRLKSIDIFRGLCMAWMILGHLIDWWLNSEFSWLHTIMIMIIDPIGASGFLFISGVSIALSYRKRLNKVKVSEDYNFRMARNAYLFRAFFIFILAILYNIPRAIFLNDLSTVWAWFVLLTAAASLFLTWPLLKTHKLFRIFIAVLIWFLHMFIISWLLPFQGNSDTFGLLFHILYNDIHQDPILIFFPFFLIGTVIGDGIFEVFYFNSEDNQNLRSREKLLTPLLIIGFSLIFSGILLSFPQFLIRKSLSWIIYSIGINVTLLSVLLSIETSNIIKAKKSYKFIFYYSYYSLTIYLGHNLLYFLFLHQLNIISIWLFIVAAFLSMGFILRAIYKRLGKKASIKVQIGRLSLGVTMWIEKKLSKREELKKI